MKKRNLIIILILILIFIPMIGIATWIIISVNEIIPQYDPTIRNLFTEEFGNQTATYNAGRQGPTSSNISSEDVTFKYRKHETSDSYTTGTPIDAGTYEILIQSKVEEYDDFADTVVLFTIEKGNIDPTKVTLPTFKPTIEGESPTISTAGTVNGLGDDGVLTGTWTFDSSSISFGSQTSQSIQITIPSVFVPDSGNYNSLQINSNVDVYAVAKIDSTYYGTLEAAIDEASDSNDNKNIFIMCDIYTTTGHYPTLKNNRTLPSKVTITLPMNNVDYTTGYKVYSNGEAKITPTTRETYGAQLCINQGVKLEVNGKVYIGAWVQDNSSISTKEYAVLMNNGTIQLNNGAYLYSYGYCKGTGIIESNSGATIQDLFRIYDYAGARYLLPTMYSGTLLVRTERNVFPFQRYSFHNVSCKIKLFNGSKYLGWYQLNASKDLYVGNIVIFGSGGLFSFNSTENKTNNYVEREIKVYETTNKTGGETYIPFDNTNYTLSNHSTNQIEEYSFYGDFNDNVISLSFSMSVISVPFSTSPEIALPINSMIMNFNSGKSIFTANSYKFLPFTQINVASDATLEFGKSTKNIFYDSYYNLYTVTNNGSNITSSYEYHYHKIMSSIYDGTAVYEKYKSRFYNYGTININGDFGGTIYNYGGTISKTTSTATQTETSAITYYAEKIQFLTKRLEGSTKSVSKDLSIINS